jgi:hypothetical protein
LVFLRTLERPTEPLNPSGWFIPNGLGYLDNPGPVPLSQLTDGQFRPSTPTAGGFGIPPSPPPSSSSSSRGDSSSDEGNSPSQPSTPTTPMENQNNLARPWLDQDVVVVPGAQHPLPKHPEKWIPKFDPDSKQIVEDHMKKFMLAIRLRNVEHEDVVCRLLPYTFEGNASTWYFSQHPHTIVSWEKFESCFLEKFGDAKPP